MGVVSNRPFVHLQCLRPLTRALSPAREGTTPQEHLFVCTRLVRRECVVVTEALAVKS
jgi:hypothetical protein